MADAYGIFGTWKLDDFEARLADWIAREDPPAALVAQVDAWWPRMEYAGSRTAARPVPDESTPDGGGADNVFVMRVPGCYLLDESVGMLRVLCFFRVVPHDRRLVCRAFHTIVDDR